MLYTIVVVLFGLWLLGQLIHFGGEFIHLLLVAAIAVFIYNLVIKRGKGGSEPPAA